MGWFYMFFSTFGYTGMLLGLKGKGAGTVSSIFATGLLIGLYYLKVNITVADIILFTLVSFILGWMFITAAEKFMTDRWGAQPRHTGDVVFRDLNQTTIDEGHGIFFISVPIYAFNLSEANFIIAQLFACLVFRIFDTWKPWIVRKIDNPETLKSKNISEFFKSFLIMFDDTAAAALGLPFIIGFCFLLRALQ